MGADGGLIFLPIIPKRIKALDDIKKTKEHLLPDICFEPHWHRVNELIRPFWQFTSMDGGAHWAKEANSKFLDENLELGYPRHIYGVYGTDVDVYSCLSDLPELCTKDDEKDDLTFEDLDLDFRTEEPWKKFDNNPWRKLWNNHFKYDSREKIIQELGPIANMTLKQWKEEMLFLSKIENIFTEETWT